MSEIDFTKLLRDDHEVTVKIEKSESDGDAKLRRFRELALIVAALAGAGIFLVICFRVVTDSNSSADDKKWATSIISAVVGGLVGALVKR